MTYLLDTPLILWIVIEDRRVSEQLRSLLSDEGNRFFFSAASVWEIAIKHSAGKQDFPFEAGGIRSRLLSAGYEELPIRGDHAVAVEYLPPIHKDPFDRLLLAQAKVEGITFLTSDDEIVRYPGFVMKV